MAYQRKTRDEWELQGHYGCGWECLTTDDTRAGIRQTLREYRENEGGNYRVIKRRVPIAEASK